MLALFIVMVAVPLEGCNSVTIHDETFYASKGMNGATIVHTLSQAQADLTLDEWLLILRTKPLICSSIDTFGDIKAALEKLCSVCNCCSYDSKTQMESFFMKLQIAEKIRGQN